MGPTAQGDEAETPRVAQPHIPDQGTSRLARRRARKRAAAQADSAGPEGGGVSPRPEENVITDSSLVFL